MTQALMIEPENATEAEVQEDLTDAFGEVKDYLTKKIDEIQKKELLAARNTFEQAPARLR